MKKIEPKGLSGINGLIHMRGAGDKAKRVNAELDGLRFVGLKKWMDARGLDGATLSKEMGLCPSAISDIRNGRNPLRPVHYILIRGLLNEGRI